MLNLKKLKEKGKKFFVKTEVPKFLLYMVVGAIVLTLLGQAIPDIYFKTAPAEAFYKFYSPAIPEFETYKPCERQFFTFHRWSNIDADGITTIELILIDKQSGKTVYPKNGYITRNFVINKTPPEGSDFKTFLDLPCQLIDGEYFWKGVIHFTLQRYDKHEAWFTESFTVAK